MKYVNITVDEEFWHTLMPILEKQKGIVLCKDCKYWKEDVPHNAYCEIMKIHGFEPDDFCSRGERKDE